MDVVWSVCWQLGGGYLFGLVFGFTIDSIGSILGATAAFWVGRTVRNHLFTFPE